MKFCLDENIPFHLVQVLDHIYASQHDFVHISDLQLEGTLDIPLFAELEAAGVGAIITRDYGQLENPDERAALKRTPLHWVGLHHAKVQGTASIAWVAATILQGLPVALPMLVTPGVQPLFFKLRGALRKDGQTFQDYGPL